MQVQITANKREALKKVRDALDFQVTMCNATGTSHCTMPLTHAIFMYHIIEDLLETEVPSNAKET